MPRPPPEPPDIRKEEAPLSAAILADVAERGADAADRLPERIARFAECKERALAMRDHIAHERPQAYRHARAAHELHHCGSYLVFRHYTRVNKVRLHGMRSCRQHTICPLCAVRRGGKLMKGYLPKFAQVMSENPQLEAWVICLTVKDGPSLVERQAHLHRSVKTFNKRRSFTDGHMDSQARTIKGAVWSYEFKRGSGSGLWHPHVHAVWLCEKDNPPSMASLSREWCEITGDSFIVDGHRMYGEPDEAFAEVFKYAVKFSDLELHDNLHAFDVLRGRRLIGSSGLLWGVKVDEDLTDDEIAEETEWIDRFFRFVRGVGFRETQTVSSMLAAHPAMTLRTGHAEAGPTSAQLSGLSSFVRPSTRP